MMVYAYVLKSQKTGRYYYGSSESPEVRLETEHHITPGKSGQNPEIRKKAFRLPFRKKIGP